jgi:hypothetical protein
MTSNTRPVLGILQLDDTDPVTYGGAVSDPEAHGFPIVTLRVAGATSSRVQGDDAGVVADYIEAARRLEGLGVSAITSNCGFAARFQTDVAAAVGVPVGLSPLLLVPLVSRLLPPRRRVGILTYDASRLDDRHFTGAGWSSNQIPIAIQGIEGSPTWRELKNTTPRPDPEQLAVDVLQALALLMDCNSPVGAIVPECSIFPMIRDVVAAKSGLPTYDFVSMATFLVAGTAMTNISV